MSKAKYFDEKGWLKDEYLWPLRQEVTLGGEFFSDYENKYGISTDIVYDFFQSYLEYINECWEIWVDALWAEAVEDARDIQTADHTMTGSEYDELKQQIYRELLKDKKKEDLDCPRMLLQLYHSYVNCPLPPHYVNVDIHWDFARSIKVIAKDEEEAEEIVNEMMSCGEIPKESFEATGDWDLDTTYQPEEK